MNGHVSPEILALHREGAVTAAKAARIDAHLANCARCSGIDAALTNLPSVLAATDLPPMPEALTRQIQMTIARESAARAGASAASAPPAPADSAAASRGAGPVAADILGRPDLPERRRGRSRRFRRPDWSSPLLLRGLAAAAAVVIIAGAGILLSNARTAPQPSGAGAGSTRTSVHGARPSMAHSVGAQVSFGAGQAAAPVTLSYRLNGRIATTAAVASHANYTQKSLPREVRRRVASFTSVAPSVTPSAGGLSATSRKLQIGGVRITALEGCLSAMAAGRQVLLAEIARFLGKPATIIVLKSPIDANVFVVGIVGLGCSASNLDMIRMLTIPVR